MRFTHWSFHRLVLACLACWLAAFGYLGVMADLGVRETGLAWLPFFGLFLAPALLVPRWSSASRSLGQWHPGRFVLLWLIAYLSYRLVTAFRIGTLVGLILGIAVLSLTWFGFEHRQRHRRDTDLASGAPDSA